MEGLINWLNGKKTYIIAFLFGVFNFGVSIGWWDVSNDIWAAINSLLGMLGWAFMRMGISKSAK